MPQCLCGKNFETDLSCSRHKSSCKVYRLYLKKNKDQKFRVFLIEGEDHIACAYCGYRARDITRHLMRSIFPHPTLSEYRKIYPNKYLICSQVEKKRKETCLKIHGDENYRNSEAQRLGVERAFRETDVLNRIRKTKLERYGDPGYVNVEKRKKTNLKKYGYENPMKNIEVAQKVVKTRQILYGDNPVNRPPLISSAVLEDCVNKKMTLSDIGEQFNCSEAVVSYWMKKHGILFSKKIVIPKNKEFITPENIIKDYFETCKKCNKVLSFSAYGELTEDKKKQRIKRLFNRHGKLNFLIDELRLCALNESLWDEFLLKTNFH